MDAAALAFSAEPGTPARGTPARGTPARGTPAHGMVLPSFPLGLPPRLVPSRNSVTGVLRHARAP